MSDDSIDIASTMAALGQTRRCAPDRGGRDIRDLASAVDASTARFEQLGELGQGGMGVVSRVWDSDLMRELAVKRVRPDLRGNQSVIAMFLWEARVTAFLDHPNIVPVHDLGRAPAGDPFFAMKRVQGISLEQLLGALRKGDPVALERWTLARRLRVVHGVCHAVSFAHRRGVIHRDLKPANIMLGDTGEVVVMDWGLAIPVPGDAGALLRDVLPGGIDTANAGTPLYMSPEQARGEALDERSDVYALGIILYELASLARPYEGIETSGILAAVASGRTRPIREAWARVPRALAAVIECALQPAAHQRYATAAALAEDLERVIDGGSPVAEHAANLTQLARFYMSRDPRLGRLRVFDVDMLAACSMGIGIAVGAAAAGLFGSWWWCWLFLVAGAIAGYFPVRAWFRAKDGDAAE